jgi:hypothetical protein
LLCPASDLHGLVVAGGVGGDAHEIVRGIFGTFPCSAEVPYFYLMPLSLEIGAEI